MTKTECFEQIRKEKGDYIANLVGKEYHKYRDNRDNYLLSFSDYYNLVFGEN